MCSFSPKPFESKLQPFWYFSMYLLRMRAFFLGYVLMFFILYWWEQIPLRQKSKWLGAFPPDHFALAQCPLHLLLEAPAPSWDLGACGKEASAFKSHLGKHNFLASTPDSLALLMFWICDVLTEWQTILQFYLLFGLYQNNSLNIILHFCIQTILVLLTVDCLYSFREVGFIDLVAVFSLPVSHLPFLPSFCQLGALPEVGSCLLPV